MDTIFDAFMIIVILVVTLFFVVISKRVFRFIIKKDLPLEILKDELKTYGYIFKSYTAIEEKLLPTNTNFDQLWSFFRLHYAKSFYKVLVIDETQKTEEYIFLKYYQSLAPFLNDKYFFKK